MYRWVASPHCLRLFRQEMALTVPFARLNVGSSIAASITMMAMVASSSMSVNARRVGRAGAAGLCPSADFCSGFKTKSSNQVASFVFTAGSLLCVMKLSHSRRAGKCFDGSGGRAAALLNPASFVVAVLSQNLPPEVKSAPAFHPARNLSGPPPIAPPAPPADKSVFSAPDRRRLRRRI